MQFDTIAMGRHKLEVKRVCAACDSKTTCLSSRRWPYAIWRFHDGNWYCKKCYRKYIFNPVRNQLRYRFGYLRFYGEVRRLTGICSQCKRKVGDSFVNYKGKVTVVKKTDLHHWFYLIIMPWACREELCPICHAKESKIYLGRYKYLVSY